MDKLTVICVGTGYFAQFHYQAWQRIAQTYPVEIIAVIDTNLTQAAQIATQYQIPHHYKSLPEAEHLNADLIDIITPPATHYSIAMQAFELGAHVICQKPFCQNYAQAEALTQAAQEKNLSLIIHENFRFMPWYRQLAALIKQNKIGHILNTSFKLRPGDGQGADAYLARQPYFQKMPRFLVHETAIHIIDVFRYLIDDISEVSARLRQCNPVISGEDSALVSFNFNNGSVGLFDGNRCLDHAATNHRLTMGEMWLEGTQGCLRLDGEARIWFRPFHQIEEQEIKYKWQNIGFGGDCVYLTIAHICEHFINQKPIENCAADYLTNLKIEEAIYQSDKEKRVISL